MGIKNDYNMQKIICGTCGVGLYSDLKITEWKCSPCSKGISPSTLKCIACALSNGVFLKTDSRKWLHLFCALLLKPYIKSTQEIKIAKNALNCTVSVKIPQSLYQSPCVFCKSPNKSAAITCYICKESMHISCVINKTWKIVGENFDCGCSEKRKGVKKLKNEELPPVRGPESCSTLEHIMERIIKADFLMIFRENCQSSQVSNRDSLLNALTANMYIDYADEHMSVVIKKKEGQPSKKHKLTMPHNILHFNDITDVVGENEPKYVSDYRQYEDKMLTNLDFIYNYYIRGHAYFSMSQVQRDLRKMILSKLHSAETEGEKIYINNFWSTAIQHLKKSKKIFEDTIIEDWRACLETNEGAPKVTSIWHKEAFESREYTMINDYQEVSDGTNQRLLTRKKGNCNGESCEDLTGLGPFELINSTWTSENVDRATRVECSEDCECLEASCKNRQISLKQFQKLDQDVKEVPTWGFDIYTYRNIMAYIRHPVSHKMHKFISKALSKAINSVKSDNWNLLKALEYIINDTNQVFKLRDKRYADGLHNAILGLSEIMSQDIVLNEFRIHPKGTGVICLSPIGIPKNSLIIEYFGELYSPAKWYEKQDLIKSLTNQLRKKDNTIETLPDFYNIMLERHHDDPEGYDVLIVDPIFYGSYGSRLSHSCTPNCGTVTMVADGKYSIGMYALNDIKYLDELTFDYNSITESREEHLNAVCLCASSVCRSYYLAHAQNSSNIPGFHNFLHRASLMLHASINTFNAIDQAICDKFCIRSCVLNGCPNWLKTWISLVLLVVEKEADGINLEIYKKITIDSRLQNLVMTVDKVKYCMKQSNDHEPYHLLTPAEVQDYFWGTHENSLRQQLKNLFSSLKLDCPLLNKNLTSTFDIRLQFLKIRDFLRIIFPNQWKGAGIADMLHLIAYTRVFFTELCYASFESSPVKIRHCEIAKISAKPGDFKELRKKYSSFHIQGTLCGWYKQTVEKPAASLSADKRGTLSLACIEIPIEGEYSAKLRKILIDHIREKPHSTWPSRPNVKYPWGNFTNKAKVLGSPMFDSAFFEDCSMLSKALDCLDLPADKCQIVNTYYKNTV